MIKLLSIGVPGAGKGTQAKLLQKEGILQISTGDLIREAYKNNNRKILPYKDKIDKGGFLPDEILIDLVNDTLKKIPKKIKGYNLDGAVRTLPQAKIFLRENLIDSVLFFKISKKLAIKRISQRMFCKKCGGTYLPNVTICPKCKISTTKREDDNPNAVKKRFEVYSKKTQPVLNFLKKNSPKFYEIDASLSVKEIFKEVKKQLKI